MDFCIPYPLPSITFEPHPDDEMLYVVWWATLLDQPFIESMWLPLGFSLARFEQAYGKAGMHLLHTRLYHQPRDHGTYLDIRKIPFVLEKRAATQPTYRLLHDYLCPLSADALEYTYHTGRWWRRTKAGWLLAPSFMRNCNADISLS